MNITATLQRIFNNLPKRVKVQNFYVGEGELVFAIAEVGNNHNGDFELAKKTILAAKEAGAHAVKFQKRKVDEVFTKEMREMPYVNDRSLAPTYGEHREKLEFSKEQFQELKDYAESLGLVFFVTPFDKSSADFLEDIGVHAYKISSFDVTNLELLEHVAKKGKPILLSTGMSTLAEIDRAVETILEHNNRLIVNHCTSIYPTPDENIDLNMVRVLKERYAPLPVGYSGHEPDILPTVASIALGANTVERHFTLDKTMRGSDHHMSIEPKAFAQMAADIKRMRTILGSIEKRIHEAEVPIRHKHAKSIVSAKEISEGAALTKGDLTFKSPGKPEHIDRVIGRRAKTAIPADTVIEESFLV
jgi:sialic acid synthase